MGLIEERNKYADEMVRAITEYKKRGFELASAEANYKMTYDRFLAIEKSKPKEERVPSGTMDSYLKGLKEVADARMKRDQCEVLCKSAGEYINAMKIMIRITNDDIQREWSIAEQGGSNEVY